MSLLYGCLTLQSTHEFLLPIDGSSLDFRRGSHLVKASNSTIPGDFILAADKIIPTAFVPSRNEKIDAVSVGSVNHSLGINYVVRLLLAINSEKNDLQFPELINERLYKNVTGRYLICISQAGPHSHFIFLVRNVPLYILGVTNDEQTFLLWSNEPDLEERLKREHGNKFYYYRFIPLTMGSLVLQTKFLCTRFRRWNAEMGDRLKIFSALERSIMKNIRG